MLEELIQQHEKDVESLRDNLIDAIQPYVNAFCNKYDISFGAGWNDFWFHFGNIHRKPDEGFLKQLDEKLFEALNYEYDDRHAIGSILEAYEVKIPPKQLVYIHCNHRTEKRWLSEKSTELYNIAEYGLMSRKMALHILSNDDINLREW